MNKEKKGKLEKKLFINFPIAYQKNIWKECNLKIIEKNLHEINKFKKK